MRPRGLELLSAHRVATASIGAGGEPRRSVADLCGRRRVSTDITVRLERVEGSPRRSSPARSCESVRRVRRSLRIEDRASNNSPGSTTRSSTDTFIRASPRRPAMFAERFDRRAYDAVHVASAMVIDDDFIVVVTSDPWWSRVVAAASAAGVDVAPPF